MTAPTPPTDDERRVAELQAYAILGGAADLGFADIIALAAQICRVPTASIDLLDADHQWSLRDGVFARGLARQLTFCAHTILQAGPLIVPDAQADPRFRDSPLVMAEPFIRFYAGVPLISPRGVALGALSVVDSAPRRLDAGQQDALVRLGRQVVAQLELRRSRRQYRAKARAFETNERLFQSILAQLPDTVFVKDTSGHYVLINESGARLLGRTPAEVVGRSDWELFPHENQETIAALQIKDRELMTTGIDQSVEEKIAINGEWRSFLSSKTAYRDGDGVIIGMIGIAHDITDRVRAGQQLRYSQQHLDGIVALSTDAIISIDEQQRICLFNRAAEQTFGYAAAEILGQPLALLIPERFQAVHANHVGLFNARPNTVHAAEERGPVSARRRDGSEFPIAGSISNVTVDGNVIATVCLRDISEDLRVQEQLRLLESAVYHTTEAIMVTSADLDLPGPRILFVNPAFCAMTGYAADEVIGQTPRLFQGPETDPSVLAQLREDLIEGRPFHGEVINYRKDGAPYCLEWTAAPIRNAAGAITHFVALQRDISARKRAQRQVQASDTRVRRSMHRLQSLYEIGQAILSATSLEMIAQQAVRHIADLIPCSCASVVVFDTQASAAHTLAINFRGQVETPPARSTLRPAAMLAAMHIGEPLVISQSSATGTPLPSRSLPDPPSPGQAFLSVPILSQDRLIGSLNLEAEHDGGLAEESIDIAREVANMLAMAIQHARLFQEIQAGRDRLEGLSRQLIDVQEEERRHLARELHDEIGQSLTVIQLNLQNLDGAVATPEAQASVHDSTRIAQNLLKQIRTLSLNLRPSMLDDLGLISTLRWYLDQQAQRSGLSIHFSAEDSGVAIDPPIATACFRIVQESLTNILRYANASSVTVGVTAQGGRLELRVSDNGGGFDLPSVRAQATSGTSLGILGMEERAALLGGVCEITSAPGQGTQVRAIFALDRSPLDHAKISR